METFASQTSIFLVALSQRKRRPSKPSTVALWTSLSHNWIVRLYARSPHGGVQPRFCPGQGGKIQLEMENLRDEQRPTSRSTLESVNDNGSIQFIPKAKICRFCRSNHSCDSRWICSFEMRMRVRRIHHRDCRRPDLLSVDCLLKTFIELGLIVFVNRIFWAVLPERAVVPVMAFGLVFAAIEYLCGEGRSEPRCSVQTFQMTLVDYALVPLASPCSGTDNESFGLPTQR